MPSLAELQGGLAGAMTAGDRRSFVAPLLGGADPDKRLDIHLRHYEGSLTAALREKFAACAWLAGSALVDAAARAYVHAHPPRQLCIAEYGADFPRFLANHPRAPTLPYLESFAELEWAVGQVSIAISHPPLSWPDLAQLGPERLLDSTLVLQPGLRYLRSGWGVDELMALFLCGSEPERFELPGFDTFIEVRGARGAVRLTPLDRGTFAFRVALTAGNPIGTAAERALEHDATFDPGEALRQLASTGYITATRPTGQEHAS